MDYQVTTAPLREPVTLAQAKRHLRVDEDDTASDGLLQSYLRAARLWCEDYAGRAFLWQGLTLKLDSFPALVQVPRPPLVAVSSVTYVDTAGATQTVDTSVYDVDTSSEPGKILLAYDGTWPAERGHHHDITITCTAGHAAACTRNGNTLLVPGWHFTVGDCVQVHNVGGALPAALTAGTDYYIVTITGTAVSLAASAGGSAIALADAGTGTHYIDALPESYVNAILLRLTRLWFHRGDDTDLGPSRAEQDLLGSRRIWPV